MEHCRVALLSCTLYNNKERSLEADAKREPSGDQETDKQKSLWFCRVSRRVKEESERRQMRTERSKLHDASMEWSEERATE